MDLSGLIFVVLAVAWAGYLIPRALRHHEEIAAHRPVDSFSDTMRVLERTPATMKALLTAPPAPVVEKVPQQGRPATAATAPARTVPRSGGHGAARRRRRVLGLLLLATATTAGVAGFQYLPWVSVAVPGILVVGWLVLCRLMVRRAPVARRATTPSAEETPASSSTVVEEGPLGARLEPSVETWVETTLAASEPDDGSLWDPLPLTLPTYVSKPAARRTVRTIDLTQTGVTSSGHMAEDTQLARAAEAEARAANTAETESGEAQPRKAAGA